MDNSGAAQRAGNLAARAINDATAAAKAAADAANSAAEAAAAVLKRAQLVELPTQTLTYSALIVLGAGITRLAKTGITGLKAGEILVARSVGALPEGYALCDVLATGDGQATFNVYRPALAIGANFSFNVRLFALRPMIPMA